jgi:hypothetical protein
VPPKLIDLAARLQDKLPEVAFDDTPLHQALAMLSQLSTIRIHYDWDAPGMAAAVRKPIELQLKDVTVDEALAKILASVGLTTAPIGDQLQVTVAGNVAAPKAAEYAVDDLIGSEVGDEERLGRLIEDFVAPESWKSAGGQGTISVAGKSLAVSQTPPVHREVDAFLDRLRKARGKSLKNPAVTLASRLTSNRDLLSKPLTMNFRPGVPLDALLDYFGATTGGLFTADYPALMSAGFQGTELVGAAADKNSLADVLSALCGPREWAWRVVGDQAVELTTREGMRRRAYVEFYKVPPSMTGPAAAQGLIGRIRNTLADEGWRGLGGRGEIAFDEPSGMLIVRQHQEAQFRLERALTGIGEAEAGEASVKLPGAAPRPTASPSATAGPPAAQPTPTVRPIATPATTNPAATTASPAGR